jgi:hypothetical protein
MRLPDEYAAQADAIMSQWAADQRENGTAPMILISVNIMGETMGDIRVQFHPTVTAGAAVDLLRRVCAALLLPPSELEARS